ncbi:hypothetical protein SAMN05421833_12991 [Microbispora rosea]|uniref:Uncharacterized protein n=1 Tax=Microbispora rosea TaxID=58117 RepID=A0A1N7GJ94_9ACTN|nr:hypothetical protein SAMN05421833_12991 [Microbispora rosea]
MPHEADVRILLVPLSQCPQLSMSVVRGPD